MTGTHIICDTDSQKVVTEVNRFTQHLAVLQGADCTTVYSTTPVMVGVLANGQANLMVFTSCLIMWECTPEQWKSHEFKLSMSLQK